jgi:phage shock protein A
MVWKGKAVMSILKRMRAILASNIKEKIENAKVPKKEINTYIREIERDVREISGETEAAVVYMNRAHRNLSECQTEINKMERFAAKSLETGNEEKARRFLEEKLILKPKYKEYEKLYEQAAIRVEQMKLAQDKLSEDVTELSNQRDMIAGKLAMAKSKKQTLEMGLSQSNVRLTIFDQLEEKANRALAETEALEQLRNGLDDDMDRLESQYDKDMEVDREMEELKRKAR